MSEDSRLTAKQRIFVEGCIANGGNATKAARDAGYKHPNVQGSQNLVKLSVRERINARINESQVHTDEVIGTLVSQMRSDIGDFMPDDPVVSRAKELGLSHLIKKLTVKSYWDRSLNDGEGARVTETTIELHSSQAAAKQLCTIMGLDTAPQKNPYDLGAGCLR